MKLLDFFRRAEPESKSPEPHNVELLAALKAHKVLPSSQTRAHLLTVLAKSVVYVAIRELPPELRATGPIVVQKDTPVTKLTSTNSKGESMGLIFSDHANVQARKKGAASIAMSSPQAARQALDEGARGLVINPAGDWAELSRSETEELARQIASQMP